MSRRVLTIVTVGTRGDVQPYVALGLGLAQAGKRRVLVADVFFELRSIPRTLDRLTARCTPAF